MAQKCRAFDQNFARNFARNFEQLEKECCFEPAGFNKEGIQQHILDVLNERRRNIRRGHDYTQVIDVILLKYLQNPGLMDDV